MKLRSLCTSFGLALLACAGTARAQGPVWLTGDRVLVSDGGTLYALALGPREVLAASDAGLLSWDFTLNRWNLPIAPIGDLLANDRIARLALDRLSGDIYLMTMRGDAYRFTPAFDRWERVGDALPPDVRASLERGGVAPRDPVLDAVLGSLSTDSQLRRWPVTDIVAGERPGEYWVATGGGGLLRFESRGLGREWLRWGLLSKGTAALAFDGARVWFGGDGRSARNGVAAAEPGLDRWEQLAAEDGAPGGFVAEILPAGDHVWFASSDGVYRLDARAVVPPGARRWTRFTTRDGLLSFEATALARAGEAVWVGTRAGIAVLAGDQVAATLLPGRPIHRVAAGRDTAWIASADGLHIVARASTGSGSVEEPPGDPPVAMRTGVEDVVAGDDAVYVLAAGAIYRWSAGAWSTAIRDAALTRIAPIMRLAFTDGRLWVAGARGVAWYRGPDAGWRTLDVPRDIPVGPVVDVLVVDEHVWVATPDGAVRLRLPDRNLPETPTLRARPFVPAAPARAQRRP